LPRMLHVCWTWMCVYVFMCVCAWPCVAVCGCVCANNHACLHMCGGCATVDGTQVHVLSQSSTETAFLSLLCVPTAWTTLPPAALPTLFACFQAHFLYFATKANEVTLPIRKLSFEPVKCHLICYPHSLARSTHTHHCTWNTPISTCGLIDGPARQRPTPSPGTCHPWSPLLRLHEWLAVMHCGCSRLASKTTTSPRYPVVL
jgi:hypothetical protein